MVPSESISFEDLITEVSGYSWEQLTPYVHEFALVMSRIVKRSSPKTRGDMIEIGAAVWASMDVELGASDVIDGEAGGKVISMRRFKHERDGTPHVSSSSRT